MITKHLMCVIRVPEPQEKVQRKKVYKKLTTENILNLATDTNLQIQETQ